MTQHNFLVIGGGGREHAIAWKLAQSSHTGEVFCCPGNGGTATEDKITNLAVDWQDFAALSSFITEQRVAVTVVGPEAPLVAGLADYLTRQGHYVFGPGAKGARLEGSKAFCKEFLLRHGIATAGYREFRSYDAALDYVRQGTFPAVIKFDGLAGGKGVTIAPDVGAAADALADIYKHNKFGQPLANGNGDQGHLVIVEEFLTGEEVSCMFAVSGGAYSIMQTSRDHKPRDDGNQGPNTGGMGAYTPAFLSVAGGGEPLSPALLAHLESKIVAPTVQGLLADGIAYCGFLYAGLITDGSSAKVLEYNCRLGDPETEPLMFALQSDLAEFFLAAKEGGMGHEFVWAPGCALSVVMTSGGYPHGYKSGLPISGLDAGKGGKGAAEAEIKVFHCGTTRDKKGQLLTAGGRVLAVTGLGENLDAAYDKAYGRAAEIGWPGCHYRKDIGKI